MKKFLLFVGMTFFVSISHFNMQAMGVLSDRVANGLSVGTGVVACGITFLATQSPFAVITLPVFGGVSYWGLRKYTPDQIFYSAGQTNKELMRSKIGLMFDDIDNKEKEITIEQIAGISKNPTDDAFAITDSWESRLLQNIDLLELLEEKGYGIA